MLIKVDEDGKKAIESLCDVALKTGGIQNLSAINNIMGSIKLDDVGETANIAEPK